MSRISTNTDSKISNITEKKMMDYLIGNPSYLPAQIQFISKSVKDINNEYDALIDCVSQDSTTRFIVIIKANSQPAHLEKSIIKAQKSAGITNLHPMIFVPYLNETSLMLLRSYNISGIDLSGNCIISSPSISIWRSGSPNSVKESRPIKNPYSGDSSIIARCFLLQNQFGSLDELRQFAINRIQRIRPEQSNLLSLGTVSKVIQALESEIIVKRSSNGILLTDAQRLMDQLRKQYRFSSNNSLLGKTPYLNNEIWMQLSQSNSVDNFRYTATGLASATYNNALWGVERLSLYVDDLTAASKILDVKEERAFANIELIETNKKLPFFDCQIDDNRIWASRIQTWLELAQGGAREQEASKSLEQLLLKSIKEISA